MHIWCFGQDDSMAAGRTVLTYEATPKGNEELEDKFGGWAAGVEAGVLF